MKRGLTKARNSLRDSIARAVKQSGLTHRELSRRSGVSDVQISNYVAGRKDINGEAATQLMSALGLIMRRGRARFEPWLGLRLTIQTAAERARLDYAALAKLAGLPRETVYRYMRETNGITTSRASRLLDALEIEIT